MIPEPCPACGAAMEDVRLKYKKSGLLSNKVVAMKCYRCNLRFDIQLRERCLAGTMRDVGFENAIREWNEVCRQLREKPFQ